MTRRRQPVAAVVVPDSEAWALWGSDLSALGFEAAAAPEQANVLIGPARVPEPLVEAAQEAWGLLATPRTYLALGDAFGSGASLASVLADRPAAPAGTRDHTDHGEMDHGDMMAITGEPSADGLVMEDADVALGPLLSPLPGGLLARIALDGDVVASCTVEALLHAPAGSTVPDPLAERAWSAAFAAARAQSSGWGARLAAVEVERALSHLVWLRRLGRLLGWGELTDRAQEAVSEVVPRHRRPDEQEDADHGAVDRVARLLGDSRRLESRTRGVAVVTEEEAVARRLAGPNARASREGAGDAHSRILLRANEAGEALRLADRLRAEDPSAPARIGGPRGPVRVRLAPIGQPVVLEAPGAAAALATAAVNAVGLEWSRALVALHSFDLSPWRVGR